MSYINKLWNKQNIFYNENSSKYLAVSTVFWLNLYNLLKCLVKTIL